MIAEKTKSAVKAAVASELKNCTMKYENMKYHSLHEAESVLLEEMQETNNEIRAAWDCWNRLHKCVRENDIAAAMKIAQEMENAVIRAMEESAQVAACAKKLQRGTEI
ncbi:MAG: hypothetical protein Q4D37_10445 [Oscillospiraceae bacterium]|nr:hypothetical protein [Oscillospiraceae bacterium]